MSSKKVMQNYCGDMNGLADILVKLVNSYRLLVGSADELNKIALSSKSEIKNALDRVEDLGEIIDEVLKTLDCVVCNYTSYCRIKATIVKGSISQGKVVEEINEELCYEEKEKK